MKAPETNSIQSPDSTTTQARALPRERYWALAILALVFVGISLFAMQLPQLKTTYSVSQFLPENHPLITSDHEVRRRFFIDDVQPILVVLEQKGSWLANEKIQALEAFSDELQKIEGVSGILSLSGIQVSLNSEQAESRSAGKGDATSDIQFGRLSQMKSEADRVRSVLENPLLVPGLISKDQKLALIIVRTDASINNEQVLAIVEKIRVMSTKLEVQKIKVEIGGVPTIQAQLAKMVSGEVMRFLLFALLASCLALMVVFRTWSSFFVPLVIIVVTNVFVLSLMAALGLSMSVLAVTVPILVAVNVLSLGSHTMLRVSEEWLVRDVWMQKSLSDGDENRDTGHLNQRSIKWQTILRTFKVLTLPNLMTAMTTAVGFLTLLTTKVPIIREYGISVAIAVFASWAMTTVLLGPLLLFVPIPEGRDWAVKGAGWSAKVFQFRWLLVPTTIAFSIVMGHFGQDLKWSAKLFDDLPKDQEARRATEKIDSTLGGTIPFEIVIDAREPQAVDVWNQPERIRRLDRFLHDARSMSGVGSAVGLPDLIRQSTGQRKLPTRQAVVSEQFFLMQMAEESPLKTLLTAEGTATRVSFRLTDMPSDEAQNLMQRLQAKAEKEFPEMKVMIGGMGSTVHILNDELSKELMLGFWQALGAIALLILVVFRSLRWTLVAVLPNLLPAATLLGILALMGTPMKPGVAIVFSIALGIAFDNTIYLLGRLRSLIQQTAEVVPRPTRENLIRQMLTLEANPCLISTLCLLSGFAIFLMSQFQINATFGCYVMVSLIFGFLGDVFFMPAFLTLAPRLLLGGDKLRPIISSFEAAEVTAMKKPKLRLVSSTTTHSQVSTEEASASSEEAQDLNSSDGSLSKSIAASLIWVLVVTSYSQSTNAAGQSDSRVRVNRKPAQAQVQSKSSTVDIDMLLKNVEARVQAKDEDATIKMIVIESNGASKTREMEIKRKSGDGERVMVRMRAPADVKGIALLSIFQGKNEDQWLYLPSTKKSRRVVSSNRNQKFMDSEFNMEDFSSQTYLKFQNRISKQEPVGGKTVAQVESVAKDKATTLYSKILTWVDVGTYQILRSEYFDHSGKLLKTMEFKDYKQFPGNVWRAQTVEVKNVQNRRGTTLKIAGLKLNVGLDDDEFTQSALED